MDTRKILADLKSERDRIDAAIKAIESLNSVDHAIGRRTAETMPMAAPRRRRPRLSAAARKRLSEMMKKRWAAGKMGKKKRA